MTYLFDEFKNIRTPRARTRVYRDGVHMPELSSDDGGASRPLHIIHIGKITGAHDWSVGLSGEKKAFFTARIETAGAVKIRIMIDADRPGAEFDGKLIIKNSGDLDLEIVGNNVRSGTKIKCETKLFAAAGSAGRLRGLAVVPAGVKDAETDIGFSALCDPGAKSLSMSPAQRISGAVEKASHSASIYAPAQAQIRYLAAAGLSAAESAELLNRVFMEEVI